MRSMHRKKNLFLLSFYEHFRREIAVLAQNYTHTSVNMRHIIQAAASKWAIFSIFIRPNVGHRKHYLIYFCIRNERSICFN